MSLDPSIPLGVKAPEPANPLTTLGQYANIANAMQQNKLLGIQQQRGEIGIQSDQTALQQAQQNQATQGSNRIAQQTAALLVKPDLSADDVVSTINNEVQQGSIPQQVANTWLQNVQQLGNDPGKLRTMLTAHLVGTLSGPEAVRTVFGAPTTLNDGRSIVGGSQNGVLNPAGGGALNVAGGNVPLRTSPEFGSAPRQIGVVPPIDPATGQRNPNAGAPVMGTQDQFEQKAQGGTINGMTNGRVPTSLRGPNAQPAQPGVVTGMGPGQQAATETSANASAKAFSEYQDQVPASRTRGAVLDNMLSDTTGFTTGPGAATIQRAREIGGRFGLPVDTDATSAAESFNKLAAQLSSQQGAGSDARLAVGQASNPHADLSPQGVDLMLRQLRGNEDYLQVRAKLAASYPDQTDRAGFESKIASQLDPRTFQYDRMNPQQKAKYFTSLGGDAAKKAFIKAHDATQALLGGGQ